MSLLHSRLQAPDLVEAVVGYRQWRLDARGLTSPYVAEAWTTPVLAARCRARELGADVAHSGAPLSGCTCGIYAWYRPCPRLGASTTDLVSGAVVLWGRLEAHATGMRAEFARIVALDLSARRRTKRERIARAAEALGVEAVPHAQLAATADRYGKLLPDVLKPDGAGDHGSLWRLRP
jgi:hypothetical protein